MGKCCNMNRIFFNNHLKSSGSNTPTPPVIDSDLVAYMEAEGITDDETLYFVGTDMETTGSNLWDYVGDLITSLKSAGLWYSGKGVAFYPLLTPNKINLFSPLDEDTSFRMSYNVGGAVEDQEGLTFNGVDDIANTHIVPIADGLDQYTGMSIAFYSRTNTLNAAYFMGSYPRSFYYSEVGSQYLGMGGTFYQTLGDVNLKGIHTVNRKPNNLTHFRYLKDAVLKEEMPKVFDYFGNKDFIIGAIFDGVYYLSSPNVNLGCLWIGEGLTEVEETTINTIIDTFITNINRKAA